MRTVVLLALLLSGCGSSGPEPFTPPDVTEPSFIVVTNGGTCALRCLRIEQQGTQQPELRGGPVFVDECNEPWEPGQTRRFGPVERGDMYLMIFEGDTGCLIYERVWVAAPVAAVTVPY